MASVEIVFVVKWSARGRELESRLQRLRNQGVRGSRSKMRRLMRKGVAIVNRYCRDADLFDVEVVVN